MFIPQVIYERGDPWWIDMDRVKLLIRPPELSGQSTSCHLVAKQGELATEMMNFSVRSMSFML
jgi:hypothetical protein